MSEIGEQFLHRKDTKLHTTGPVEHEQIRRRIADEPVSQKPADKIASWLKVIERTHTSHKDDPRVLERIRGYYHREYIIDPENIPQSYWNLQGEIAVNEGHKQDLIDAGVIIKEENARDKNGQEIKKRFYIFPEQLKEQAVKIVISNQQRSLDKWIDHLTSEEAPYPMWARYWTFRSVVKMGKLEKTEDGKTKFSNREKDTVASFPVLNHQALAKTINTMRARLEAKGKPKDQQPTENLSSILSDDEYQKLLSTEDFSKIYAQFLAEIPEYQTRGLEETQGKWVKYKQGSSPKRLVTSLAGHPLEWCTADLDTARAQLKSGDFYVYYSLDENGKPTIPRLAIRMEEERIAEPPRGIAPDQNLDPYIAEVLEKKLEEFGEEGNAFKKRAADMKQLTKIEKRMQAKQALDTENLRFLYEIDSLIEGFGYYKDPRIKELKSQRNPEEDLPVTFNCDQNQIARSVEEIGPETKVYVGLPGTDFFNRARGVEYLYVSFPERRIRIETIEIGGKSKDELKKELVQANIMPYDRGSIFFNPDFITSPNPQKLEIIRLKVSDLGFNHMNYGANLNQIFARAKELGLELCPPEVGPYMALKDVDKPLDEWHYPDYSLIAMKPVASLSGFSRVFSFGRERPTNSNLIFRDHTTETYFSPEWEFVFSLTKAIPNIQKPNFFQRLFKH